MRDSEEAGAVKLFYMPLQLNRNLSAEQMRPVFKDEILRGDLIRKGKIQAQKFMPQPAVSAIWNGLDAGIGGKYPEHSIMNHKLFSVNFAFS